MKPTVEAVLLEFGISFPIRNEITIAKKLIEARVERDEAREERDAWELSSTNWQADCRVAQSQLAAERAVIEAAKAWTTNQRGWLKPLDEALAEAVDALRALDGDA